MPVAEAGQTTTEFKALIGAVIAGVFAFAGAVGLNIPDSTRNVILAGASALVTLAVTGYQISRGLRKAGTDQGAPAVNVPSRVGSSSVSPPPK
ncbi:MAG: hypothetical protein NVS3B24_24320 [Candidatus Dormibacteria bacterium]